MKASGTQYGIRWPSGSVFAFPSQEAAEEALREDGRGVGVLVAHEYEAGTSNCTEWREVEAGGSPGVKASQAAKEGAK